VCLAKPQVTASFSGFCTAGSLMRMRELPPDATVAENEVSSAARRRTMTEIRKRDRRKQTLMLKERLLESAEQARGAGAADGAVQGTRKPDPQGPPG
jgi:hypothetical protein